MSGDVSVRDAKLVVWLGGARGIDEESELVRAAIVDRRITRYGPLVVEVAERLFARDNACVGGIADIGFFRPWYFGPARRLLARLDGTLIQIGATSATGRAEP
jgi:hypothetical protein